MIVVAVDSQRPANCLERVTLSVLIPNHNYGIYLGEAIDSVLASLRPADEVIVVDDGSTDDSVSVARRYDEVTLLEQENRGQTNAVMAGVDRARGDVIVLLDSDDRVSPHRLGWIENAFRDSTVVMAWHPLEIDDGSGKDRGNIPSGALPSGSLRNDLIAGELDSFAVTSGLAIRRSTFRQLPAVSDEFLNAVDSFLIRAVLFQGNVASTSSVLGSYRVHSRSQSRRAGSLVEVSSLLDRRVRLASSERNLVRDLDQGLVPSDGPAADGPPPDGTFIDLWLMRARLAAPTRRQYWDDVRRSDFVRAAARTSVWFALGFYGLLPVLWMRALVEIKLTTRDPTGIQRLAAKVYWKIVFLRLSVHARLSRVLLK